MSDDIKLTPVTIKLDRRATLKLAAGVVMLPAVSAFSAPPIAQARAGAMATRDRPFDDDWRFFRGDATGIEAPGYADQSWRAVDLPHDWSIEDLPPLASNQQAALWADASMPEHIGPFDRNASEGAQLTAFTVGGTGWYRKHFTVPGLAEDGRVELLFDGVYMNSDVWINGRHLGNHPYGYSAFGYELTSFLNATGDNVVAVRVRNTGKNSRWYSGSGIYRQVKLVVTGPVRIACWGVGITTTAITRSAAQLQVNVRIDGTRPGVTLVARVFDPAGRQVAERRVPGAAGDATFRIAVAAPQPWSPDSPIMYRLETELRSGDTSFDLVATDFGIRKVVVDARRGLLINGKSYKMRGGCVHHDNGLLGAAAFPEAEQRRVALLKERGFNAIRTSHNPPSAAFLDACDRAGMLVIDEAFDVWKEGKNPQDYHQWFEDQWRADLASMVLRDRNHPSVILWSIGNEIPERLSLDGNKTAWMLAAEVRTLDASHPITAAINGFSGRPVVGRDGKPDQPVFMYLDVAGYNYRWPEYERDHLHYPDRVMVGTESYPGESYDVWTTIDKLPYAIGDFVWTGLDHLGEAGLGSTSLAKAGAQAVGGGRSGWPWIINNSGDIDLIGQQKPQSLARDVVWGLSPVEITVQRPVPDGMVENVGWASWSDELASWTWPGAEGKALAVRIFTMGDRVELQLNGKTVGTRSLTSADKGKVEIPVPYVPGELIAVASRGGQELGRRRLITAGAPAALRLRPYRASLSAARSALTFITVEVVDAAGQLVPDAMLPLRITLDGPADLAAFGSANPRRPESFQDSTAYSYHGRAQAILRGRKAAGQVAIRLSSQHLTPATTVIPIAIIA